MGFWKIIGFILMIILVAIIIFEVLYVKENFFANPENLRIIGYNNKLPAVNASSEVIQFYDNLRFNHNNISYSIEESCSEEKTSRLENAFSIISDRVVYVSFIRTYNDADIEVICSSELYEQGDNVFIAGEGGPTKIVNSTIYPVILKGKVTLYKETPCDYPVTELHELFHVFGFDHINDSETIMYPYVDCRQTINQGVIDKMDEIYSIAPSTELLFEEAEAVKLGRYLNFSVKIKNAGIIDAKNVSISVYSDKEKIDYFDVGLIEFGSSTLFYASNIRMSSSKISNISIEILSKDIEITKENNKIYLEI